MQRIITDSFPCRISFEFCGRGTLSYCLLFLKIDSCKIGGLGKTVQININESEFVKRNCYWGHRVERQWVFSDIDSRLSKMLYAVFTLSLRPSSAALIRGRRLFKHCTKQIYFFYIFIQWHTFYLLLFLWTDTNVIVYLELWRNSRGEKTWEFHDNEGENISGESIGERCLFEGGA